MSSNMFDNINSEPINVPHPIGFGTKIYDKAHFHSLSEFVYVLEGNITIHTPFSTYEVMPGDIVLTSENTPHFMTTSHKSVKYLVFYMSLINGQLENAETQHILSHLISQQHISHLFKSGTPQNKFVRETIEKIHNENLEKKPYYQHMIETYTKQLNFYLLREGIASGSFIENNDSLKKILPTLKFINNNYNTSINVSDVSRMLYFSDNHFGRIFKRATGVTFTEYLNCVRIRESQKLLKETSKSIGDIASEVGFSSQIYFCRCFKKYNKCTPTEFRKANPDILN